MQSISFDVEYKERETDPYQRILNLKKELIDAKLKIDEYAEKFNDNTFIKESDNFNKVFDELDLYKSKIDAFINYEIFNKLHEDEDEDEDENSQKDKSESNNNSVITDNKQEFVSVFEKYNRITQNLLSIVKMNENDILNNNFGDVNVKYEICSNPEMQIETLMNRLSELEDMVTTLERSIGNWNLVCIIYLMS